MRGFVIIGQILVLFFIIFFLFGDFFSFKKLLKNRSLKHIRLSIREIMKFKDRKKGS